MGHFWPMHALLLKCKLCIAISHPIRLMLEHLAVLVPGTPFGVLAGGLRPSQIFVGGKKGQNVISQQFYMGNFETFSEQGDTSPPAPPPKWRACMVRIKIYSTVLTTSRLSILLTDTSTHQPLHSTVGLHAISLSVIVTHNADMPLLHTTGAFTTHCFLALCTSDKGLVALTLRYLTVTTFTRRQTLLCFIRSRT